MYSRDHTGTDMYRNGLAWRSIVLNRHGKDVARLKVIRIRSAVKRIEMERKSKVLMRGDLE